VINALRAGSWVALVDVHECLRHCALRELLALEKFLRKDRNRAVIDQCGVLGLNVPNLLQSPALALVVLKM
jgi:hypothetical protein